MDCAPYLTLYASGVKDWSRSFWSAVLQHRFRFGWRDDFHVGQSLVQAGPRWAVGLDDASPSNAGFAVPSGLLFCGANLAATRLPHPHLRCGFCFVKTRSLVGWAVICPPDAESTGCFSRTNRLPARSRARNGADGRIPAEKLGLHDQPRRAVDCAPYLTLYASTVKDWRRSFWSAVLQHRFWFH